MEHSPVTRNDAPVDHSGSEFATKNKVLAVAVLHEFELIGSTEYHITLTPHR